MDKSILVAGDIILDRYITGSTNRISPEAPVPVVKIEDEFFTLGGAANVANNLINLTNDINLIGAIGKDNNAKNLKKILEERMIKHHLYSDEKIPTTTKTRVVSRNQQMIRLDREDTFISTNDSLKFFINDFDNAFIIISDYAKGFCDDLFFKMLFNQKSIDTKVFIDPKGSNWEKYNGAFLIKPNLSELEEVYGTAIKNDDDEITKSGKEVFEKYKIENLLITRGKRGMTLINKNNISHFSTKNVDVYDVSGAGDTAMAVLVYMMSENNSLEESIKAANLASSYVVTKPMTYAINKAELDNLLSK